MKRSNNPYYSFHLAILFLLIGPKVLFGQGQQSGVQDQSSTAYKHHVIVALDRSGSVRTNIKKHNIEQVLSLQLPELLMQQETVLINRALLQSEDYLSIVSFGFNKRLPNVDDFIQTTDEGFTNHFGYAFKNNINTGHFQELWNQVEAHYNDFFRKHWTGLSFAGPMALNFLKREGSPSIHRTFLAVVTDGEFNTIEDPNNEINIIANETIGDSLQNKHKVFSIYNQVRKFYFWEKLAERQSGSYKIILYEYTPTLSSFAIESLCTFNQDQLFLNRKPRGFEANIPLTIYENDYFKLNKIDLEVLDQQDQVIKVDSFSAFTKNHPINIRFDQRDDDRMLDAKRVSLKFWVTYKDQIYNAHELHPNGSALQGAKGLQRIIPVEYEARKKIFGLIPMPSGLYKLSSPLAGQNQQSNIHFWNFIFGCGLILLFSGLFFRYVIKNRKDHKLEDVIIKTHAN